MPHPRASAAFTSRALLDQIADKWTAPILSALCHKPRRFNEVKRALDGITQTALTKTLRRLERNGLVERRVIQTKPIAVEYAITPLGYSLQPLFEALDDWTIAHFNAVQAAQANYDAREPNITTVRKRF